MTYNNTEYIIDGEYTVTLVNGVERMRIITPKVVEYTPSLSSKVSQTTYRSLFTFDEQTALYEALPTSIPLQITLDTLKGAPVVDLTDPRVEFGLGVMVAYQCLAYNRIAEIISYQE